MQVGRTHQEKVDSVAIGVPCALVVTQRLDSQAVADPRQRAAQPGEQVAELAEAFDLLELMDRAPQSLSKGERLRVAIAAAVSTEPKVLMLDEPTAGQDAFRVRALLRALRAYFSGTLLVVTHDVDLALSFGSRIVVLEGGMCAIEGAPSEVFQGLKSLGLTTRWSEFSVEQFGMVFDPLEAVDA